MLKKLFNNKNDKKDTLDENIIVISKTEPGMCGGTDATQDTKAPKKIESEDMFLFHVTSALNKPQISSYTDNKYLDLPEYVSAFAATAGRFTFLFISTGRGYRRLDEKKNVWAFVKGDVFTPLVNFVREYDLAKKNGFHSQTHGLPENFGGNVDIRYADGQRISFSDNQCPVISFETGIKIIDIFSEAMKCDKVDLPKVSTLRKILFEETGDNGSFTRSVLTLHTDGTGTNEKKSRYDDPKVYESTKKVDKKTIDTIREIIQNTGILAWSDLPDSEYSFGRKKRLIFCFEDETEIVVQDCKIIPEQIRQGFFNIQLEMTTRH